MEENTAGGQGTARGDPQASRWYRGWGTILHQASILRSTPSSVLLRGTKPCLAQPWSTLWFPTGHEAASVTVKCNGFAPALGSLCWAGWSSDGTLQQCQCCSRLCPNRAPQPPELSLRSQRLRFPISALANPSVVLRWEAANPLSIATLLPINHPNGELAGMFKAPKGTGRGHFQSLKPKVFNN